jgi:hypothetical protein
VRSQVKKAGKRRKKAEEAAEQKKRREAEEAEFRRQEEEEEAASKRSKVHAYLEKMTTPEDEGGAGFASIMDFFETLLLPGGEAQASANVTRFFKSNGKQIIEAIIDRVPAVGQEFLDQKFDEKLEKVLLTEGQAIQELLTRGRTTSIMELLEEFSMEQLGDQLEEVAPTLWRILEMAAAPGLLTRREKQGDARREKRLVSCGSDFPNWDTSLTPLLPPGVHDCVRDAQCFTLAASQQLSARHRTISPRLGCLKA